MQHNSTSSLGPASKKLALSWADVILILFILAAGVEAWRTAERLTPNLFENAPAVDGETTAIARHEQGLQRAQADISTLRAALLRQQLDSARERATLAALAKSHPGIDGASTPPNIPESDRALYARTRLNLAVEADMFKTIEVELARAEADAGKHAEALRLTQRERESVNADADRRLALRRRVATVALSLGATAAVLLLASLVLPRAAASTAMGLIHPWPVIAVSATGLAIIAAHLAIGAIGSLTVALISVGVVLARGSRAKPPDPGIAAP
jgi:hypothetical protein